MKHPSTNADRQLEAIRQLLGGYLHFESPMRIVQPQHSGRQRLLKDHHGYAMSQGAVVRRGWPHWTQVVSDQRNHVSPNLDRPVSKWSVWNIAYGHLAGGWLVAIALVYGVAMTGIFLMIQGGQIGYVVAHDAPLKWIFGQAGAAEGLIWMLSLAAGCLMLKALRHHLVQRQDWKRKIIAAQTMSGDRRPSEQGERYHYAEAAPIIGEDDIPFKLLNVIVFILVQSIVGALVMSMGHGGGLLANSVQGDLGFAGMMVGVTACYCLLNIAARPRIVSTAHVGTAGVGRLDMAYNRTSKPLLQRVQHGAPSIPAGSTALDAHQHVATSTPNVSGDLSCS